MKVKSIVFILVTYLFLGCKPEYETMTKVIFLHHSTGQAIWNGKTNRYVRKLTKKSDIKTFFNKYNRKNKEKVLINEQSFPKDRANYPFDYYDIWVKNGGESPYMADPTLEMLTKEYNIIIFKHCFPGSEILEDTGNPNIDSNEKRLENYKLQYSALKEKMLGFPANKFILWTPAVHVKNNLSHEQALRTRDLHKWLVEEWDDKGDNIFLWDFYMYETEGGLYLKDEYARNPDDSHPNQEFSGKVAPLFAKFIIDVAKGESE